MRFYLIISVFIVLITNLLGTFPLQAMNPPIKISGRLISAEDEMPIPFVHIINARSKQGTVSNTEGRFWIEMEKTDTLIFSAIGFEKYAFTLKETIDSDQIMVTIALNASTMELEPVHIYAYKNERSFKQAILDLDVPLEDNKRMQLEGFNYGPEKDVKPGQVVTTGSGVGINGPISALSNAFGKRGKQERKLKKYQEEYAYQQRINSKYNPMLVSQITGLKDDDLGEFMEFCKVEDRFVEIATEYEIVVVIHQCFRDYEKKKIAESEHDR